MKNLADFHIHSKYSFDAVLSPEEIVSASNVNKVSWISITDHNNMEGSCEIWEKSGTRFNNPIARFNGVNVVSGVEVTCRVSAVPNHKNRSCKVHLLVYGADLDKDSPLMQLMEIKHNNDRDYDFGLLEYFLSLKPNKIREEDIRRFIQDKRSEKPGYSTMSNLDIFEFLQLHGITVAKSYRQFEEMLKDAPRFERVNIEAKDLIDIAHASGGIVVMAHPSLNLRRTSQPKELLRELVDAGIDGFEKYYTGASRDYDSLISKVINEKSVANNMIFTGGSDIYSFIHGNCIGSHYYDLITVNSQREFIKEIEKLQKARVEGKISHRKCDCLSKDEIEDVLELYRLLAECAEVETNMSTDKKAMQVMPKLTRKKINKQKKKAKKVKNQIKKQLRKEKDSSDMLDDTDYFEGDYQEYLEFMEQKYGLNVSSLTECEDEMDQSK